MKKIGYLRVSTEEQNPARQVDGLTAICDELFVETISGAKSDRPIYQQVVSQLERGDVLVVWDLDRAYRSSREALNEIDRLQARGIAIRIVNLDIDTTTPAGLFVFTLMAALATFERHTLSQRTKEGLESARKRGAKLGRPRKLTDEQLQQAEKLIKAGHTKRGDIAKKYGVATWTLTRSMRRVTLTKGRQQP
ncbi:hypothetical protein JP75_20455 [Devosia riboflavina]|uniref:Resolvase/invertase-type recombinase catalytic domain-containing protein n=1 Tax=Devosia riboflavina TaxID=46914 RepID=A0A087LY41_9HYPH|nr:recombinase family protein [Devosia riboflavina]KFL29544.1 hypothetical protein JP75_20455 [Devosia riboflavina]